MAKKRNLEPESSQLVEPPLKQHHSEAQQENLTVQEDEQAFEQSSTSPFGLTNSVFGQNNVFGAAHPPSLSGSLLATPNFLHPRYDVQVHRSYSQKMAAYWKRELKALGTPAIAFEQSSTSPFGLTGQNNLFGPARLASLLVSILAMPVFLHASYDVRKRLVEAFWKNPFAVVKEFLGIMPFGRATPPLVWKQLEEAGGFGSTVPTMTREQLEAIEKSQAFGSTGAPAFGATNTPAFGAVRVYEGRPSPPISITSCPTITEKHGGTSGQTAKLESISAMSAYNYERFESCVAIAGADYCVIAVDFTRDHTKISQLSGKCVMAACCGFQADVKALQVLSAENLKFEGQHKKPMSCPELHRLFCHVQMSHPIYDSILLGGLDSEGKGCLFQQFGPDAVAPRVGYSSQDSGSRLIEPPILKYKLPAWDVLARLSETEAVNLAKNVFASTTNTDKLEIVVLNASGLRRECVDLRKD